MDRIQRTEVSDVNKKIESVHSRSIKVNALFIFETVDVDHPA